MNARKTLAVFAVLVLTSVEFASAAVNNVNSRGQFVPMGSNQMAARRSYARPSYSGRVYRAPAVVATPAPMVATAPTEGRRFSYAPAPAAAAPCPSATATAPTTDGARRFSYAPALDATVTPAPAVAPRVNSTRPSYSGRSSSRSTLEQWQLPKTDSRKYLSR
jgi:hypothetical protein